MKRVVVTGLGIVSPIGLNVEENWTNATNGRSGIARITQFDLSQEPIQIGGEVKNFDPYMWMSDKEARRSQRFVQLACAASKQALQDAGLADLGKYAEETAVVIGVGVGGLGYLEEQIIILNKKGSRWVSPFTIPGFIPNMAAGIVSIETGAKGPNLCTTTACTSGTHAIGEAMMLIQTGRAKIAIAGGAEASISPLAYAGFGKMKAMATGRNDSPEKGSRPFDLNRNGFVMGEGSGILILEDYESAKARGARIYCELGGYGMSSDAFHMTTPSPGGEGAARCMRQALATAGINASEVDYINAHGTSTEANDSLETAAIKSLFADNAYKMNISSTKSMTGHLLGAAGGVEAVFTVKSIESGIIPPTINLDTPDPQCDLNYTPHEAVQRKVKIALSNSFGFGGTNGTLLFKSM